MSRDDESARSVLAVRIDSPAIVMMDPLSMAGERQLLFG